ncbi:MAG: MaoC/PaaZ C-terminal domain-containing protein [Parvibaculaceae bacterium]
MRDSEEFRTNTQRLAQFAEAIGDTNPRHLSGSVATPVFNHVPVMQSMVEVLDQVTKGFILHGQHDFLFHRPIVPGQRLFSQSQLIGTGSSKAGALYFVRSITRTHDGHDVCTQFSTCLVQGASGKDSGGRPPDTPKPARSGEPVTMRYPIPADLTLRYADAARDYSPYTIDPVLAAANGLPAPIVHGMCTLALIARGIVEAAAGGDVRRLKRLGCRFSHPLYLTEGQELRARLWQGSGQVAFEAEDKDGNVVVKNGFAEVAS